MNDVTRLLQAAERGEPEARERWLHRIHAELHRRADQKLPRDAGGRFASGFGSMPFNHTFSFPSKTLSNEVKNDAMKALAAELVKVIGSYQEWGHPLERL